MELRGGERFRPLIVRDHDQRAGRLLAHERATNGSAESIAARRRGEEYLLERKLFRRKTTGEVVDPAWLQFSFPTRWNTLRALRVLKWYEEPDTGAT